MQDDGKRLSKKMICFFSFTLLFCFSHTLPNKAQAEKAKTSDSKTLTKSKKSSAETKTKPKSPQILDHEALFGGLNFVNGMSLSDEREYSSLFASDEIEGEVTATSNPYTSIPEPTGMVFGTVFDPEKEKKQAKNPPPTNALTGLGLLINALQAGSNQK